MKIQIDNFGPIHYFECDLDKDLHLILGTNNIGKSYGITVVYLLVKSLMEFAEETFSIEFSAHMRQMPSEVLEQVSALNVGDELDIIATVKDETTKLLQDGFLTRFQDYVEGTFGSMDTIGNRFSREEPHIRLVFGWGRMDIGVSDNAFIVGGSTIENMLKSIKVRCVEEDKTDKIIENEQANLIIYHRKDNNDLGYSFFSVISIYLFLVICQALAKIHTIHYLPASRSGLYPALSAFGQIVAELAKSRSYLNSRIQLPGIAVPLSDYFLQLSQIKPNKKQDEDNPIHRIADDIERDILKGTVEFDKKTRELFYIPNGTGPKLDMGASSSMVSELSPIVSFLRHIVSKPARKQRAPQLSLVEIFREILQKIPQEGSPPKPLLFIEEPEAHLHPENQLRLMAAFAALANAGVKVMITTHSDFLFNKLNNLILEKKIDTAAVSAMLFRQTEKGGEAVPLPMDELGIEDDNFIDTTEALYDEKVDLIDRMNRGGDDGDAG
uniref:AAA ATPase domain-containing protein n=1 Tax=Candidatus Kentrum sp. FM TaxID=2126340 RepID=A0A450S0W3_9GAMM|nr:MAG: AAA ATPase domain-containing protein [Candidatus Kentron sp. FM]VFJ63052.1 MAG: AAA ATPase domain-containing protein [Candidatus Kentron sp. FM]VFK05825.1 MAG: AAA ATPase domain-containing protein [Candidatus Kentron sp. FM]